MGAFVDLVKYFSEELSGEVQHIFPIIQSNMLKIYLLRWFSDFPSSNMIRVKLLL